MKCVVTICSKIKNNSRDLIPAYIRYQGEHVLQTYNFAIENKIDFYILSGKFGLISANELIDDYDYYLEDSKVEELSMLVAKQIEQYKITELIFFLKEKPSWEPYKKTLYEAAKKINVKISCNVI